jgi:hypothetical protein
MTDKKRQQTLNFSPSNEQKKLRSLMNGLDTRKGKQPCNPFGQPLQQKLVIQALKPKPLPKSYEQEQWQTLEQAVYSIQNKQKTTRSLEELYRVPCAN